MTHDELMTKIDESKRMACWVLDEPQGCGQCLACIAYNALRAVVELHKPFEEFGDASCEACFNSEYSNKDQPYPCTTIQAIEKELR